MAKLKKYSHKLSGFFIVVVVIVFAALLGVVYSLRTAQNLRLRAEGPSCHPLCQTEPSCCADIIRRMNELGGPDAILDLPDSEQPYHECPALYEENNERGYCRPETCNQLPAGVQYRGRCGWYWGFHEGATNTANGYGCMIGDSEATMQPICGGGTQPSNTPRPTSSNPPSSTPIPTRKPTKTPKPTKRPKPTKTPVPPTATPYNIPVTATPIPNVTQQPNYTPPVFYISTTPFPTVPIVNQPEDETDGEQLDIISTTLETLRNFLDSIIYSIIGQRSSAPEPTASPKKQEEEQKPPVWESVWKGIGEFFTTVAP